MLSHAILLDVNIATFVFHYPQFIPSITNICKSNTLSSTSNQHVIWSPSFSAAMMFCLGLTLSASSISVQEIVQDNLQLMMKEVAGLEVEVLKDEREDADPDHHEGDDSSTATPAPSTEAAALKRSQFSNQTRQLEGLIFITQLLVHDEIRSNLSRVDIDMNKSKLRNQLYSSLRSSLSSIYRSINRGRSGLNEVNGVNSMALSYYDKAIKNVKALLSLLEGGVSSKAD